MLPNLYSAKLMYNDFDNYYNPSPIYNDVFSECIA